MKFGLRGLQIPLFRLPSNKRGNVVLFLQECVISIYSCNLNLMTFWKQRTPLVKPVCCATELAFLNFVFPLHTVFVSRAHQPGPCSLVAAVAKWLKTLEFCALSCYWMLLRSEMSPASHSASDTHPSRTNSWKTETPVCKRAKWVLQRLCIVMGDSFCASYFSPRN